MPRLTYWQVFRPVDNNTLEVLKKVKIGSVELDQGARITRGTIIGGLDLFKYLDLNAELEGKVIGDAWELKKIIYTENG